MKYLEWLHYLFFKISNFIMAIIPRKTPTLNQFKNAKVMAHRGIHNRHIKENTLAAFQKALEAKVWGIELDIRWTKDLQPVVHHDVTTQRVFGKNIVINQVTLAELQQAIPEIPSLQQVAEQLGKKIKLVIEFKAESYTHVEQRQLNLQQALKTLIPIEDFYLISLESYLLQQMRCYPSECYFPIGRTNLQIINDLALQ
jgi:glycerophosphoryl diester phosphodiesterase